MDQRRKSNNEDDEKAQDSTNDIKSSNTTRDSWGSGLEFLMSCIALSVGLGNVWRFPFVALDNGGGAFIIPYLIVLFLVGRPIYYLEMVVGQFSSRNSIRAYHVCPISKGIGVGQIIATTMVNGYYAATLAVIIHYFVSSFYPVLPWSHCLPEWGPTCIDSAARGEANATNLKKVPLRLNFIFSNNEVLKEKERIFDGAGAPDLRLSLYLLVACVILCLTMIKGIKSSGKASYFFAIFPYVILLILFVRAVTLPGAVNGIIYLYQPQWDQLLTARKQFQLLLVWYAAVTQVMFSLGICFGSIIMFASYNRFSHNIHRDATIVTLLDTFTSLFSATTIFGILGNLAYENGSDDVAAVVSGDTGLAFVSYPNAISKFQTVPQLFSVLFFFMLFILGIGSNVAVNTSIMTIIKDKFSNVSTWKIVVLLSVAQLFAGLMYVTPGGQPLIRFIDYFGASFVAFFLGICQLITFNWLYGVNRLCFDIEFMLGLKTGYYWRICWAIITPALMIAIFIYNFATYEPVTYKSNEYPDYAYAIGWVISVIGVIQLPVWAIHAVYKQKGSTLMEKFKVAIKPSPDWGPRDAELKRNYQELMSTQVKYHTLCGKMKNNIFG